MEVLLTILQFFGVLAVVVIIHELGHFATAKAFGVQVHEFGFGFPPRLLGVRRGETVYTLNLLPLGGFVRMEGESDPSKPRSLARKGVGTRLIVLAAGPFMNVVLGLVLLTSIFWFTVDVLRVGSVVPDSAAERAGLLAGDKILKVNGQSLDSFTELDRQIDRNGGQEMEWLINRDGAERYIRLVPELDGEAGEGATAGISVELIGQQRRTPTRPLWGAFALAAERAVYIPVALKDAVVDWIADDGEIPFAGPIGIAQGTGEIVREYEIIALVPLAALLSISLAIFNILPIPALDGGRIVFVMIEWVRRGKRIPPEKEGFVHVVGFVFLIGMLVALSYNDIVRLVEGNSILR